MGICGVFGCIAAEMVKIHNFFFSVAARSPRLPGDLTPPHDGSKFQR